MSLILHNRIKQLTIKMTLLRKINKSPHGQFFFNAIFFSTMWTFIKKSVILVYLVP